MSKGQIKPGFDYSARSQPKRQTRTKPPALSKREQLIRMLSAPKGAGADKICKKLGWQLHTTRAAVSGLRKLGFEIHTEPGLPGKGPRYRIVSGSQTLAEPNAA